MAICSTAKNFAKTILPGIRGVLREFSAQQIRDQRKVLFFIHGVTCIHYKSANVFQPNHNQI
jgi:hypothetical protein